ncbi:helix-turn-helix domain-containing protein [Mesobacillus zeae]|uniref:Helix-turn-helix domain-containing protein n=1 Tax=Mesobacillus zeae TaxID=1917180 RepID=A0A398B6E8_9BACI|nr:helix-turn-helix domain-containing protein [Mesobacillus zeae]RID85034.1 helix-turn-helix domain-containing protein [Mesobacillus zeae]
MAKGKYEEWLTNEGLIKVEGWARDGLTDEQIAKNIGINVATLYRWKERYCEICEALKRGKEVIDRQVENALLKRALGYAFDELTYEQVPVKPFVNEEGKVIEFELEIVKKVTKQQAPETAAAIFWLKNRRPDKWRDKQDIEHSGGVTNQIDLSGLTAEELRKLANSDN